MNCQILFSRKNKKKTSPVSTAEFAHSMVSVNILVGFFGQLLLKTNLFAVSLIFPQT